MYSRRRPGRGVRSSGPRSDRGSLAVQTSMCRRRRFEPLSCWLGPLGRRESAPRLQRRLRRLWRLGSIVTRGRQRNRGFFSDLVRGVSSPREGSKILSFLFRPLLACSSLLHLRCSGKVNCANFRFTAFSEVQGSSGPTPVSVTG
jgi:hypothetical protein